MPNAHHRLYATYREHGHGDAVAPAGDRDREHQLGQNLCCDSAPVRLSSRRVTTAPGKSQASRAPNAEYARRRKCVGGAHVRAPIVRFGVRDVAGQTILIADERMFVDVLRLVRAVGWPAGSPIHTGCVATLLAWR